MAFWHELVTEKSWKILNNLQRKYKFILIGGWAVFLYTRALKSVDIDIVCEYEELEKLKRDFDVIKNFRLKKYEARVEEIGIDIYLPFFSNPGIPAEKIKDYTNTIEGFVVPRPEVLLVLKQRAYSERRGSVHGEKDKIDIISLLMLPEIDLNYYLKLLKEYKIEKLKEDLIDLLKGIQRIPVLKLSNYELARLKKQILSKLS